MSQIYLFKDRESHVGNNGTRKRLLGFLPAGCRMGAQRAAFQSRPLVGEGRRSCPSPQRRVAVLQRGEQLKLGFKEDYEAPGWF